MNPKKKLWVLISVLGLIFATGIAAYYSRTIGLCSSDHCAYQLVAGYAKPVFLSVGPALVLALLILSFGENMIKSFFSYAVITIPLLLIAIFASPMECTGGLFICFDRVDDSKILSLLFVVITCFAMLVKSIQWWIEKRKANSELQTKK